MLQSITGTWQLVYTECIGEDGAALAPPYGHIVTHKYHKKYLI